VIKKINCSTALVYSDEMKRNLCRNCFIFCYGHLWYCS